MSSTRSARALAIAVVCIVMAAAGLQAQQRWYEAYDAGVKAFERGDWNAAESSFASALAKNPKQGRQQLFYGTIYADYIPDFYLARIFLRQGKTQQAVERLDRLSRAGLMRPRDPEYAQFTRLQDEARTVGDRQSAAAAPAPAAPREDAPAVAAPPPTPPPAPPAAADTGASPTPDRRVDVQNAPAALDKAPAVSQLERNALRAYYRGAYDEVLEIVRTELAGERVTGRLLLYAACSHAALGLLQRPDAERHVAEARQQFARAERLGAVTLTDTRYISPRILQTLRGSH